MKPYLGSPWDEEGMGQYGKEWDRSELSLVASLFGQFQHWPLTTTGFWVSFAAWPFPSSCYCASCLQEGNGHPCSTSLFVQLLVDPKQGCVRNTTWDADRAG